MQEPGHCTECLLMRCFHWQLFFMCTSPGMVFALMVLHSLMKRSRATLYILQIRRFERPDPRDSARTSAELAVKSFARTGVRHSSQNAFRL